MLKLCILVALALASSSSTCLLPGQIIALCPPQPPPPQSCKILPFPNHLRKVCKIGKGISSQVWDKTYREMFTMALLSGSEQVCSFGGVDGLRQTCESVWSGGGRVRPAAHSGPRTAARQPHRARCPPRIARCRHRTRPELRRFNNPTYSQDISTRADSSTSTTAFCTTADTFTRSASEFLELGRSKLGDHTQPSNSTNEVSIGEGVKPV